MKTFKKFLTIDWNDYMSAVVNDEFYLSIVSKFVVTRQWLFFKWKSVEQQYQKTIKMIPTVLQFLSVWSATLEASDPDFTIDAMRQSLKNDLILTIGDEQETELAIHPEQETLITKAYGAKLLEIHNQFDLSWENPVVLAYLSQGWQFLIQTYAGVATRDVWLVRMQDDLMDVMMLKLFGKEDDSVVALSERLLLNKQIIDAYLESVLGGI